jgi:hypothetical protein
MSALCHYRREQVQRTESYSITSSAVVSSVGGHVEAECLGGLRDGSKFNKWGSPRQDRLGSKSRSESDQGGPSEWAVTANREYLIGRFSRGAITPAKP